MVFLIRAKNGWTKELWDMVKGHTTQGQLYIPQEALAVDVDLPSTGLLMKMNVDGPFGSAVRVKWERHNGVVIVVGGSGVSYGLAILEYLCGVVAKKGKDGGEDGVKLGRVRFVWLVRDFGE